jgi:HSP20 family molecular chaperone IbpA
VIIKLDKRKRLVRNRDSVSEERDEEDQERQHRYSSSPLPRNDDELRRRVEDLFSDVDLEIDYLNLRLNDFFFRVQSIIKNLTSFPFSERALPNAAPPETVSHPRRSNFDLVNFNSEVFRRFILSREEPLVETAIDEVRGELRILVIMPGVRKEDIELELTESTVTARSLAPQDTNGRRVTVPLPVPVKMRSIETSYANGVLEVKLKLKAPKKYYKVRIK